MELELGLKITRTRDDITSYSNLHVSKDPTGLVLSRETETSFILIVYLKGFRRENIDININEDGTRITVSGRKPIQEMVLTGWMMHKRDVELRMFKKVFRIPDGVILDKIKAKFSRQESALTIIMPKLVQGLLGTTIEEIKEETTEGPTPSVDRRNPEEELQGTSTVKEVEERLEREVAELEADQVPSLPENEKVLEEEKFEARPEMEREATQVQEEIVKERLVEELETGQEEKCHVESHRTVNEPVPEDLPSVEDDQGLEKTEFELARKGEEDRKDEEAPKTASHQEEQMVPGPVQTEEEHIAAAESSPTEPTKPEPDEEKEEADQVAQPAVQMERDGEIRGVQNESEDELVHDEVPEAREEESKFVEPRGNNERNKRDGARKRRKKPCPPLVFAGSAIIFSLIVLVISLIRPKKP